MNRYLALIMICICFGFIGIFIKLIGNDVPIMTISFLRFFLGFLFLAVLIPFIDHNTFHNVKENFKHYIALGFLLAINISTFNASLLYESMSNIFLIFSVYIIFVSILSYIILHEKITKKEIVAMILGIIGLGIIYPIQKGNWIGITLILLSALTWAFFLIYMRYFEKNHSIGSTFWMLLFGVIFLLPFFLYYGVGKLTTTNVYYLILIGVLCTALPYLLLAYVLERLEVEKASIILFIFGPIVAVFLAIIILKETPTINVIMGGIILLASGIYLRIGKGKI